MRPLALLLTAFLLAITGCKMTTYDDASRGIHVTDCRFFMNTSADIALDAGTNGIHSLTVRTRSDVDVDAIEAAARGAFENRSLLARSKPSKTGKAHALSHVISAGGEAHP
jgi:hypothetical protein